MRAESLLPMYGSVGQRKGQDELLSHLEKPLSDQVLDSLLNTDTLIHEIKEFCWITATLVQIKSSSLTILFREGRRRTECCCTYGIVYITFYPLDL